MCVSIINIVIFVLNYEYRILYLFFYEYRYPYHYSCILIMVRIWFNSYLHNIKQTLLAEAIFLLKEVMFRICPCDIASDDLLVRRRHFEIFGVRFLRV